MLLRPGTYYSSAPGGVEPILDPGGGGTPEFPTLEGSEGFESGTPTYWDGSIITGDALTYYNGLLWWMDSDNWDQHQGFNTSSDGGLDDLGAKDDLYTLARFFRERLQALLLMLGLTRNLEFLDVAVDAMVGPKGNLAVGYRGHDTDVVTWSASPFRCWVTTGGGQPASLYGTDLSTMNEVKWHAGVAMYTYALFLNKDKVSPNGKDYEAEYNFWIDYLVNDFIPKWSGGGTTSWRDTYRGVRRTPTYNTPHARAGTNQWPIVVNGGEAHSSISSTHLAYFMSKLLSGSAATNAEAEFEWLTDAWLSTDSYVVSGHRYWSHTCKSQGSPSHHAQRSAYVSYECMDMVVAYMLRFYPESIDSALLTHMAAAVGDNFLISAASSSTNISTKGTSGDIAGEVVRGGFTSSNPDSGRSMGQLTFSPNLILAPWASSMNAALTHCRTNLSWTGSTANPSVPFLNLAEFLKHVPSVE